MKIDAHQHFWLYNDIEFNWINKKMNIFKKDYLPENLYGELNTSGFNGSIAVQARQSLTETEWLLDLAGSNAFIRGVVGWVDLCSPEIEQQLNTFSKNTKMVGVRHVLQDEPDDKFMMKKNFQNGISLLRKYNLTYDLLIFPKHLDYASELVKNFPDQKFVLDHIAKPSIKNQIRSPWDNKIKKLAQNTNVFCKLSGMVTEADWFSWKASDFEYYLDIVFDNFGVDRLMIGSDWPVCTLAGSYKQIMSIVIDYIERFNKEDKIKILGESCNKFYLKKTNNK